MTVTNINSVQMSHHEKIMKFRQKIKSCEFAILNFRIDDDMLKK